MKAKDINALNIEGAEKAVAGTARSMGIDIQEGN
jgi:ribosomal protein L11